MRAPFFLNQPPSSVTVTTHPTTNELANKSNNPFSKYRFSPNGRRLIADINGQPFELQHVRRTIVDVYPAGVSPDIDFSKDSGTDGSGFGHPAP
jgi:hypothetical protein